MLVEQVKLTQVKTSADNPRTITTDKFQKLINSLLVLPKMLEIRPVVVNPRMEALGGNMRLRALKEIGRLTLEQVKERLSGLKDYADYSPAERDAVAAWWDKWLEQPFVYIVNAKTLSEAERRQFVIKDNVSFGQWDYDALANKWDNAQLNDWGVDVWNPMGDADGFFNAHHASASGEPAKGTPGAGNTDGSGQPEDRKEAGSKEGEGIGGEVGETFPLVLPLPKEAEGRVKGYIARNGTDALVDIVMAFLGENGNAE